MFEYRDGIININAGKARSIDLITSALFELLEERAFCDISVKDICEKAGVVRKTFYRNFDSKLSVVERLVDQVFYEFEQKYDFKTSGARKIYLYWYEYILCTREFSRIFFDKDLFKFMMGKIRYFVEVEINENLHEAPSFDPMLSEYYISFAAAGIASLMREWMMNDCKVPAKTMATLTARLLSGVLA